MTAPSVTLSASLPVATFGAQVTLSGVVSSRKEGRRSPSWRSPIRNPRRPGSHRSRPQPAVPGHSPLPPRSRRHIRLDTAAPAANRSPLGPPEGHVQLRASDMSTRISAAFSFAGRFVYLQRRSRFGQWVVVRKLELGPHSGEDLSPSDHTGQVDVSDLLDFEPGRPRIPGEPQRHPASARALARRPLFASGCSTCDPPAAHP